MGKVVFILFGKLTLSFHVVNHFLVLYTIRNFKNYKIFENTKKQIRLIPQKNTIAVYFNSYGLSICKECQKES